MNINKIIAIAINEYDDSNLNQIENCEKDIRNIIQVLTDKYVFDDIELISSKTDTTRKALFNNLNEYFINSLDNENVLLLYAGHGQYNDKLNTAYWLPSDADPSDSSSWFNINDLLSFIKASDSFHIAVISDSCFSGGIFGPNLRGGGISAFNSKKSRLGLSSGSIETVSDGEINDQSPFAKSLIEILNQNTADELTFNSLASNVILNFNEGRDQTPMTGPLNNTGHEGGAFIFKLKSNSNELKLTDDYNAFLKAKMGNLYIEISEEDLATINEIKPINDLKVKLVKSQKYEEAMVQRKKEKGLEQIIYDRSPNYIDSHLKDMAFTFIEVFKSKELDKAIKLHQEYIEENAPLYEKQKELIKKTISENKQVSKEEAEEIEEWFNNILKYDQKKDPSEILFLEERDRFLNFYHDNIIKVYAHMFKITNLSDSKFLNGKIDSLREILVEIYRYQVNLLIHQHINNLDELISLKQKDIEILNWIKNKE